MSLTEILVSVVVGLLVNEACDVSPWCAHHMVRWSVQLRYANPERRRIRCDELVALIDERPGKLLKLGTGLGFLAAALPVWLRRITPAVFHALAPRWSSLAQAIRPVEPVRLSLTDLTGANDAALVMGDFLSAKDGRGGLVTVAGPWGSGKTRLVNDALRAVDGSRIVMYNPWMSSGGATGTDVVKGLVEEIQVSDWGLKGVARAFQRYLQTIPSDEQSGPPVPDQLKARRRLARELRRLSRPMVVAIDDLDRMWPAEATQVFDIVARTTGLPRLLYVMSYDRALMHQALPPGLLNRCVSGLEVDLNWGTLRRRPDFN